MSTKQQFEAIIDQNHKAIIARINTVQNMFRFPQFDDKYIAYAMTSAVDGFIKQCAREMLFQQDLETIVRTIIAYRDNLTLNLESLTRKHLMSEKELSKVGLSHEKIESNIDEVKKLLEDVASKEKQAFQMYYDMVNRISSLQESHVAEWKSFNIKVTLTIVNHLSTKHNIHLNKEEQESISDIKSPIQVKKALMSAGIDISSLGNQDTHNTMLHQIKTVGAISQNAKRMVMSTIDEYFKESKDHLHKTDKELCGQILTDLDGASASGKSKFESICRTLDKNPDQLREILKSVVDGTRIQNHSAKVADIDLDPLEKAAEIASRQQKELDAFMKQNQPIVDRYNQQLEIKKINGLLPSHPKPDQAQASDYSAAASTPRK